MPQEALEVVEMTAPLPKMARGLLPQGCIARGGGYPPPPGRPAYAQLVSL